MITRPRDPSVPTMMRRCPVHGVVEHRGHRSNGIGSIHWRCPTCHNERNKRQQREAVR